MASPAPSRQRCAFLFAQQVDLVQNLQPRLIEHVQFAKDLLDSALCSSRIGLDASRTCTRTSAFRHSSSVARNEVTSVCGKSRMKTHGVRQQHFSAAGQLNRAQLGIERKRTCAPTRGRLLG